MKLREGTDRLVPGRLWQGARAFAGRLALVVVALAALDDTPPDVHAAELDTSVYFAANTFSYRIDGGWDSFSTLALSAEEEMASDDGARMISLFAEYHLAEDERVDGTTFIGLSVGYRQARWDLSGYWYASRFPGDASRPTFQGRLRGVVRDGHKLGLEYTVQPGDPDAGELRLGYYGSLKPSVSLKLLTGIVLDNSQKPMARLEISWQVR